MPSSLFTVASTGTIAIVLILSVLIVIILIMTARAVHKARNKRKFQKSIEHFERFVSNKRYATAELAAKQSVTE